MNVVYIDTRKPWMKREDQEMTCFIHCKYFWRCQTRCGKECRVLGGETIPKIREVNK